MYIHIGIDKYTIRSQFKGWISDFHILTCINPDHPVIPKSKYLFYY